MSNDDDWLDSVGDFLEAISAHPVATIVVLVIIGIVYLCGGFS